MIEERTTLEIIAPTIEEALSKGLSDLGLPESAVDVEVLDSGSRGIFGLGSRQARIRLTVKQDREKSEGANSRENSILGSRAVPANKKVQLTLQTTLPGQDDDDLEDEEIKDENETDSSLGLQVEVDAEEDYPLKVARETVSDLLEKMKVQARVTTQYGEITEASAEKPILVEIHGNDLSILIGRRSETLNALQYISSLIVGKELEKWIPLQVDVEGYRARRERILIQLAHRMADQAVSTGRKQVLEPMPANERRIIHMELHDHSDIFTESVGDEPNRKVTINLKNR